MYQNVTAVVREGLKWIILFTPPGRESSTMEATFWLRRNAESVAAAVNLAYWDGYDMGLDAPR